MLFLLAVRAPADIGKAHVLTAFPAAVSMPFCSNHADADEDLSIREKGFGAESRPLNPCRPTHIWGGSRRNLSPVAAPPQDMLHRC